jgi:hypothetical protein
MVVQFSVEVNRKRQARLSPISPGGPVVAVVKTGNIAGVLFRH